MSDNRRAQINTKLSSSVRGVVMLTALLMAKLKLPWEQASPGTLDLLLIAGAAYFAVTSFSSFSRLDRPRYHLVIVSLDMLYVTALLAQTGGMQSEYYLLYYIPVLEASLRLDFRDAIGASVLAAACYTLIGVIYGFDEPVVTSSMLRLATFAISAIILALFFGLLSRESRHHQELARQLRESLAQLSAVYDVARIASSGESLQQVLDTVVEQAAMLVGADKGYLALRGISGQLELSSVMEPAGEMREFDREMAEQSLSTGLPTTFRAPRSGRFVIYIPLLAGRQPLGTLAVVDGLQQPAPARVEMLTELASEAAVAIDNAQLRLDLQRMAISDPLTGLYNRAEFFRRLSKELDGENQPAVVILDVDNFKQINDRYGHVSGDQVLRTLAQSITSLARQQDVCARYGGDEFVIMFVGLSGQQALAIAERMRSHFSSCDFQLGDGQCWQVTATCGVAAPRLREEITADLLLDRADQALYQAKQEGKNHSRLWLAGAGAPKVPATCDIKSGRV